jgi:hypothetical protein
MPRADNLSRALLGLILVCLVVLVLRGGAAPEPAPSASPEAVGVRSHAGRFEIRIVALKRNPPLVLRTDSATGETWRMGVMDRGEWEALREGPDGPPSAGEEEPGRYSVKAVAQTRGAPTLVRTDHHSGRIWRKGSTNGGAWVAVPNPGEEPPAPKAAAAEPTPSAGLDAAEAASEEGVDAIPAADDAE